MKKLILFSTLLFLFASCGGDSNVNAEALCDGDVLIPFQKKKGKDWGFINMKGEVIIKPEFDEMPTFSVNGISRISQYDAKEGKVFYRFVKIKDGKAVISKKKWDMAGEFREGLAPVRKENAKVQFINEKYKVVFTADAEEVSYFNDGMAAFRNKEGKWGFYDTKGKVAIKPKYDFVRSGFLDGKAIVGKKIDGENNYYIIDKSGKKVLNLREKYDDVISISEGLIMVEEDGIGFIDMNGKKVIKINKDWNYATNFINGYASFYEDGEWGLVDSEGEIVFNSKFERPVYVFNDVFWYRDDRRWGVMDLEGNDVIEPEFKSDIDPYPFFCETSIVGDGRNDVIFIDDQGLEFSKVEYDRVAELDFKYVTNWPWNQTFESDLFDPTLFNGLIDPDLADITSGVRLLNKLGIKKEEFGTKTDYTIDYESRGLRYVYYAVGSRIHSFTMYGPKEMDEIDVETPESLFPREEEYNPSMLEYLRDSEDLDYSDYLRSRVDRDYEGDYESDYDRTNRRYSREVPVPPAEEKVDSKYPLEAPNGIRSVDVQLYFDDYMAKSDPISYDSRSYYSMRDSEPAELKLNKKANVRSIYITISLDGKGYGKAEMLAKALGKEWKSKITKLQHNDKKDDFFIMSGDTKNGSITVRSEGKNVVTIQINFDYNN